MEYGCFTVLVSLVQHSESAICAHTFPLYWISFPFRWPRSTEWSALCCPCGRVHARPAHCTTGRWIRETGVEARKKLELQSWRIKKVAGSGSSAMSDSLWPTPWTAACQASLPITNSWSLLKLMSMELVLPSSHLTLCRPLLLPPSVFPSIRVFSSESALRIRWPGPSGPHLLQPWPEAPAGGVSMQQPAHLDRGHGAQRAGLGLPIPVPRGALASPSGLMTVTHGHSWEAVPSPALWVCPLAAQGMAVPARRPPQVARTASLESGNSHFVKVTAQQSRPISEITPSTPLPHYSRETKAWTGDQHRPWALCPGPCPVDPTDGREHVCELGEQKPSGRDQGPSASLCPYGA